VLTFSFSDVEAGPLVFPLPFPFGLLQHISKNSHTAYWSAISNQRSAAYQDVCCPPPGGGGRCQIFHPVIFGDAGEPNQSCYLHFLALHNAFVF